MSATRPLADRPRRSCRLPTRVAGCAVVALSASLAACGGDDGDDGDDGRVDAPGGIVTGSGDGGGIVPGPVGDAVGSPSASAFAGLYDASQTIDGTVDVGYLEFTADGRLAVYDDQQDDVGTGENCHVLRGPLPVTALGDDVYLVGSGEEADEIVVTRTPRGLQITEQRFVTFNGFPQFIGVSDELPRIDAFTSADLPLCTSSSEESRP